MTAAARFTVGVLLGGLLLLRPTASEAHAFLDHAEPRVGSTVSPPSALTLQFTEPLEPALCRVEVLGPGGKTMTTSAVEHPSPATLRVGLPSLPPGDYIVHWAVISVDTHPTEGRFTFSVKAP